MKRILFWTIIGTTVLITLVYTGITAIKQIGKKQEKEDKVLYALIE